MMQAKKGFTLIELLVVIAIIAILAAILFPVFANARDKARQISDLSNIKQLALSEIMYTSDYDDTFALGSDRKWDTFSGWAQTLIPYAASYGIFEGPNDTGATLQGSNPTISYGVNALTSNLGSGAGTSPDFTYQNAGIFASEPDAEDTLNNTTPAKTNAIDVRKVSAVSQPTATILFADLQSADVSKLGVPTWNTWSSNVGNAVADTPAALIGSQTAYWDLMNSSKYGNGVDGTWEIPSPANKPTNAYPEGPSGMVSSPFSSKSLTNFAFADGHAKAMKPAATNPDAAITVGVAPNCTWDQNNLWVAIR